MFPPKIQMGCTELILPHFSPQLWDLMKLSWRRVHFGPVLLCLVHENVLPLVDVWESCTNRFPVTQQGGGLDGAAPCILRGSVLLGLLAGRPTTLECLVQDPMVGARTCQTKDGKGRCSGKSCATPLWCPIRVPCRGPKVGNLRFTCALCLNFVQ